MTMELFGDSDIDSFSETSTEDQDDIFSMYSGHAQSILSSLEDSIGKIDDFLSFERGFMHGDIVCSVANPSGQMGRIVDVKMFVDLENVFGKVTRDINSKELLRMRSILVGDYVIHGPWLGRVEKAFDNVGILFDDGTKGQVLVTDQSKLLPLSPNLLDDSLYPYHPGQRVKVGLPTGSKGGWLCGISKKNQNEGTIFSVKVGSVCVDWISTATIGVSTSLSRPPRQQDPKNLTLLSCFLHANWQLGDWCILPVADPSSMASDVRNRKSETRLQTRDFYSKFDEMFSIVKKKIKVDVMWQDGSCSMGLDSQLLFPVSVVNAHDFFPEQFVLEKASSDDQIISANRRWGVVRYVDSDERTVKVEWIITDDSSKDADERRMEETVSAYELVEHPDFSFNFGDIVFRLDKNHLVNQLSRMSMEDTTCTFWSKDQSVDEIQTRCFLSCIGNIIGFNNGNIEVQWASGVTSEVAPHEILRMEKDDELLTTHVFHEENVNGFSDEMAEYDNHSSQHQDASGTTGSAAVGCQNHPRNSRFFSLSQAAMAFLTSITGNFFSSHGSTSPPQPISCAHVIDEGNIFDGQDIFESCDMLSGIPTMKVNEFDTYERRALKQEFIVNSEKTELPSLKESKESRQTQFDVVGDCSDHHFVHGVDKEAAVCQMKKGWLKKVQQEWGILEKDLPETIFVRIYEERMDLLRAAIVGAPGTPYHDGLFFFDIWLPPDYPHVPPLVHYHSGGLRLNPNLYESGRVCLSLLNTWTGTGSEVWNPGSSTILQVLLSLQALVLNEKPYFNEAGYDKQIEAGYDKQIGRAEGEKNSVSYNENAYLGTCKSMLYLLRKPPKHFEGLVEQHFERRAHHILSACKAYMEGAPIGSLDMGKGCEDVLRNTRSNPCIRLLASKY